MMNVTDDELQQWAEQRADDAGRLARELIVYRRAISAAPAPAPQAVADVTPKVKALRDNARWLVDHANKHGNYAVIDQDHIDGLRDAVNAIDAALPAPQPIAVPDAIRAMKEAGE